MMKKLIIVSMIFFAISCSDDKEDNPVAAINGTGIEISVTNGNGNDLLDPANANAFDVNKIKLFYEINGQKTEVSNPLMESPKGFKVFKHKTEYRIGIALNENGQPSTTYIQWNATDTDTIKAEFRRWGTSSIQVQKVWYNGSLKWEFSSKTAPTIEIVK